MSSPKVLVGMLYSGENEYALAKDALFRQKNVEFDFFAIENMPNKEAHDLLYSSFMRRESEFAYYLKLDADMVLVGENSLAQMVSLCEKGMIAHLMAYVHDGPSQMMIPGIQMFEAGTVWEGSSEKLNVDYPPKVDGSSKIVLSHRWVDHMPSPSRYQLFRYGIHKALKALQPDRNQKNAAKGMLHFLIIESVLKRFLKGEDGGLCDFLIGSLLVFSKKHNSVNYSGDATLRYFEALLENSNQYAVEAAKVRRFFASEVGFGFWWLSNFNSFGFDDAAIIVD